MLDHTDKAERFWALMRKYHDLAEQAEPPFLGDFYRKVAAGSEGDNRCLAAMTFSGFAKRQEDRDRLQGVGTPADLSTPIRYPANRSWQAALSHATGTSSSMRNRSSDLVHE